MKRKPIICLDFDGVIHSYTSGWKGVSVIPDDPVPGALDFLIKSTAHFRVCVYSSRSKSFRGRHAMKRYMRKHFSVPLSFSPEHDADFLHEEIRYPWFKPPALVTLDDHALTFTGTWPNISQLEAFTPWNRK